MNEKHFFIKQLEGLFSPLDRGALAELRRNTGHESYKAFKHLPPNLTARDEKTALIIAPLFALWHQGKDKACSLNDDSENSYHKNLGFSMTLLAKAKSNTESIKIEEVKERLDKRFNALLDCHIDDLSNHLRHIINLLRSDDIAVNWEQLRRDINNWDHDDKYVQKNWARSFWTFYIKEENTENKNQQE